MPHFWGQGLVPGRRSPTAFRPRGNAMRELRGKRALVTGAASGIGPRWRSGWPKKGAISISWTSTCRRLAETEALARRAGVEVVAARCDLGSSERITASNRLMLALGPTAHSGQQRGRGLRRPDGRHDRPAVAMVAVDQLAGPDQVRARAVARPQEQPRIAHRVNIAASTGWSPSAGSRPITSASSA